MQIRGSKCHNELFKYIEKNGKTVGRDSDVNKKINVFFSRYISYLILNGRKIK